MAFINNKYTKWYFNIICNAKSRISESSAYYENHHIIPKSLSGSNDKNNLVRLTGKEHFICHILLTKMTNGKDKSKMIFAANMMSNNFGGKTGKRHIVSGAIYQKLKEEAIGLLSKQNTGKQAWNKGKKLPPQSAESNIKRSLKTKGISRGPFSEEHIKNLSKAQLGKISPLRGKTTSLKNKSYEEIYGKEKSDTLKLIRSAGRKGKSGRQNTLSDNHNAKPVTINGIEYLSMKEACIHLNTTYYALSKLIP